MMFLIALFSVTVTVLMLWLRWSSRKIDGFGDTYYLPELNYSVSLPVVRGVSVTLAMVSFCAALISFYYALLGAYSPAT